MMRGTEAASSTLTGSYQRLQDEEPETSSSTRPAEPGASSLGTAVGRTSGERRGGGVDLEMSEIAPRVERHEEENGLLERQDSWNWKQQEQNEHANSLLSAPEATAGLEVTEQESKRLGNIAFWHKAVVNLVLIALWYIFSISISIYNKWMFADPTLNFHFPLFTTSLHMVVQFMLASAILLLIPRFRPRHDSLNSHEDPSQPREPSDPTKPIMSSKFYLTRIAPCATATGLDIGLGNTSLRYVTLTFFTMCKSSVLGFVLAFAIVFRLETLSWRLAGIIAIMTAGVIMMVAGETAFSTLGFILLMLASFFSGLRWSLTQMLLRRNPATSNPFASLFFLTPIMFVVLLILAFPVEGLGNVRDGFNDLASRKGFGMATFLMLIPGVLAFLMTASEFALLKRTSVVTLSVTGIFKEVLTIGAGGIVFDDKLTPINITGLMVTIVAIAAYNYIRVRRMQRKEVQKAQEVAEERAPMLHSADTPAGVSQPQEQDFSTNGLINQGLRTTLESGHTDGPGMQDHTEPGHRS